MCGIFGCFGFKDLDDQAILDSIKHRGPDARGYFKKGGLALFHTRLSILDLSQAADQPMHSHDGRYTIIFNGEIYNHLDIRQELAHCNFKTTSDTETIISAYATWGKACLKRFNGIFAFALFDHEHQELFLARDHFGVKPLYYYWDIAEQRLAFGSELKTFLKLPIPRDVDAKAIMNYSAVMWSADNRTGFKAIKKVDPGSYLVYSFVNGKLQLSERNSFYRLHYSSDYLTGDESHIVDLVEEKLLESVKRQMLSDVPVGFFLSGGLDSTLLVAMARRLFPNRHLACFTIDTGESEDGFTRDFLYAREAAKYLDVQINVIKAKSDLTDLNAVVWHLDEPQADYAPFNVLQICRLARSKGYKVLIGGTGADDIFSGYRRHLALPYEAMVDHLPQFIRTKIAKVASSLDSRKPRNRRINKFARNLTKDYADRIIGYFVWQNSARELFSEDFRSQLVGYSVEDYFKELLGTLPKGIHALNKMLYLEVYTFLAQHNLNYTDKMGMAEGVEIRVPYLDRELVQLTTKIPPRMKLKGRTSKYILRKVAERYIPNDIIYRNKTGFGAPIEKWFRDELYQETLESFHDLAGIYDPGQCMQLLEMHRNGEQSHGYPLLSIRAVDSWHKQFAC
jgi:asparagine synthase (glutamine-hydrolysing)